MAGTVKKITELTSTTTIDDADLVVVVDTSGAVTLKMTFQKLRANIIEGMFNDTSTSTMTTVDETNDKVIFYDASDGVREVAFGTFKDKVVSEYLEDLPGATGTDFLDSDNVYPFYENASNSWKTVGGADFRAISRARTINGHTTDSSVTIDINFRYDKPSMIHYTLTKDVTFTYSNATTDTIGEANSMYLLVTASTAVFTFPSNTLVVGDAFKTSGKNLIKVTNLDGTNFLVRNIHDAAGALTHI